jgi:hypothetical protein
MGNNVICSYCAIGHPPSFCLLERDGGCLSKESNESIESLGDILSGLSNESHDIGRGSSFGEEPSSERVYKDPISTGRKRAAELYPIAVGQICAWAWKKNCGGGIEPIFGCTGRPATNIHHGPDKSTFANEASNISVICTFCHNRWHVKNDKYYSEPRPANGGTWLPNPPIGKEIIPLEAIVKATKEEILLEELKQPEGGKDAR